MNLYILLLSLYAAGTDISIRQYEAQYPDFDQQKISTEAFKIAQNKFSPIKSGAEVEITTKIGEKIKGRYSGINAGNVTIDTHRISWIDIPDEKKYLFSEDECKKAQEEFNANYLKACREKYLEKRRRDIIDFKKSALTAGNAIELADGDILYSAEIIKKSFEGISIKYSNRVIDLKYTQLSPTSRELIKSDFGFTTIDDVTYNNVQVIETGVSTVKFYNEKGEVEVLSFGHLPEEIQKLLGYSSAREAEYNKSRMKQFEEQSARELKSIEEHAGWFIDKNYYKDSFYQETRTCYYYDGRKAVHCSKLEAYEVIAGKVLQVVKSSDGILVRISFEDRHRTVFVKTKNCSQYAEGNFVSFLCIPDGTFSTINSQPQKRTIRQYKDITISPEIHQKLRAEIWEDWGERKRKAKP